MERSASPAEVLSREILKLKGDGRGSRAGPLLVALDGRAGTGKSTTAAAVSALTGAWVIDGDGFYTGAISGGWDLMTPTQRVECCLDWRLQRSVLGELLNHRTASWFPYDWDTDDGRHSSVAMTCPPADVVILEGSYSARPELADLFDLRVLLDAARPVRRQRLLQREGEHYRAAWEARWSSAEEFYFENLMRPDAFDLVISSQSAEPGE